MKNRSLGSKIFLYTLLILFLVICITVAIFANQFSAAIITTQSEQFKNDFQPLLQQMGSVSDEQIKRIAESFHERNASFEFGVQSQDGNLIYSTPGLSLEVEPLGPSSNMQVEGSSVKLDGGKFHVTMLTQNGMTLLVSGNSPGLSDYSDFIRRTAIAVTLLLLASAAGAAVFARQITRPIKKLAGDTKKMAALDFVPVPTSRKDEIGQLASDVYGMYETLKQTIQKLEAEMVREKEMEESQRYFFSSASHELKTPIAAVSAILEGIQEGVVESDEYRGYITECLNMMADQNTLISEILEIVKLSDDKTELKRESIGLKDAVLAVLLAYQTLAEAKAQTISVGIPEDLRCMLEPRLFGRVLSNIVSNAVQNTPAGERIRIWSEGQTAGTARLCILNTGAHIHSEVLPKLFEPFFRTDAARSPGSGRSGLGLTIVRKALEYMGIAYSLENTDEGVLFRMDLPV
jgi:two-component system, OmpR family, sensor histidine kinase VanS